MLLPVILSLGTSILEQMHVPRNRALLEKNEIKKYRAARNKVDIRKSIALLYTSNKQGKFEIKTQYKSNKYEQDCLRKLQNSDEQRTK